MTTSSSSAASSVVSRGASGAAQQACAACKYQRRRCTKDCLLAPFFPPERQRQFVNAHRLFGVSNIVKVIRQLDPAQRREAMASICFHAEARALDPAGGCFRIVLELEDQIRRESAELEALLAKLARCRAVFPGVSPLTNQRCDLHANENENDLQHRRDGSPALVAGKGGASSSSPAAAPMVSAGVNHFYGDYEDEVKPHLVGMFECKQPLLSCNANDHMSSSFPCRSNVKEEMGNIEDVQEHDLKGAASLFSLFKNGNHSC